MAHCCVENARAHSDPEGATLTGHEKDDLTVWLKAQDKR
jgi:hypothetical protein